MATQTFTGATKPQKATTVVKVASGEIALGESGDITAGELTILQAEGLTFAAGTTNPVIPATYPWKRKNW